LAHPVATAPLPLREGLGEGQGGTNFRAGLGWDLHRLVPGRRFLLGGVELPSEVGEEGHSDADVLCHAVTDALLGAAALGDIGELYPPSDPRWKGASSIELLKGAWHLVRQAGWRLVNLDCVVICEKQKVLPYREAIRRSLAEALEVRVECVFVKGKTAEGLGETGAGKAISAQAQCLLESPHLTSPRGRGTVPGV
jgi:2-C-methyl-D-erythritol 2,4-cyclodiphosphate synthase/2-C-methyl-D-erythritol 4-phosphate cytidylyltransferase/2-C-methyl-D-erythritol 2,4-cyclodiphosphate synthase